jgi:hypothetical protein
MLKLELIRGNINLALDSLEALNLNAFLSLACS